CQRIHASRSVSSTALPPARSSADSSTSRRCAPGSPCARPPAPASPASLRAPRVRPRAPRSGGEEARKPALARQRAAPAPHGLCRGRRPAAPPAARARGTPSSFLRHCVSAYDARQRTEPGAERTSTRPGAPHTAHIHTRLHSRRIAPTLSRAGAIRSCRYFSKWKTAVRIIPSPRSSSSILQDLAYSFGVFQLKWYSPLPLFWSPELPGADSSARSAVAPSEQARSVTVTRTPPRFVTGVPFASSKRHLSGTFCPAFTLLGASLLTGA